MRIPIYRIYNSKLRQKYCSRGSTDENKFTTVATILCLVFIGGGHRWNLLTTGHFSLSLRSGDYSKIVWFYGIVTAIYKGGVIAAGIHSSYQYTKETSFDVSTIKLAHLYPSIVDIFCALFTMSFCIIIVDSKYE